MMSPFAYSIRAIAESGLSFSAFWKCSSAESFFAP